MKMILCDPREWVLIKTEIRQFASHPRSLHFVPLTMGGVMIVLWPYLSSPLVSVLVVLFAGLEPQFNNIFFRTPLELESLSVLPLEWKRVVESKNVATMLLVLMITPIISATVLYFSPSAATLQQIGEALLFLSTVLFPLIHIGNMRSVQHPRRATGWQVDDLAGIIEFLISLGILSIPCLVFVEAMESPVLCLVYFVGTVIFWWRYSIPKTAGLIESRKIEICLTA